MFDRKKMQEYLPREAYKAVTDAIEKGVKSISVFDGNTGESFDFSDTDEIRYVVENIQSTKMKKDTLSIGYSGYSFRISFFDENGKEIENFMINSSNTIRKDPFFYRCDGNLCFDYLKELEEKYSS